MSRRSTGALGEKIAAEFLERRGFEVLECNYLRPWGEIDIIALKNGVVHFVEVKTLSRENTQGALNHQPEDLGDRRKLRKLSRTAELYMESKRDRREFQIDVVGVILSHQTKTARCRLLEQAL